MKKNRKNLILMVAILVINVILPSITLADDFDIRDVTYNDNFSYTQDGDLGGMYPSDGTSYYQNNQQVETVKNYDFDNRTTGYSPDISQILGKSSSFDGGYHEYRDPKTGANVYMKKIVKPTSDPTIFEVQLDVIGGKKETQDKIDIAFVFDKSGSMVNSYPGEPKNRWTVLKEAFNYFADDFFDNENYDARFAISSFASVPESGNHRPYFEIAQFNDGSYYTDNKNYITTHPMLTVNPNGGTPTFLGVEAGMELLTNHNYGIRQDANQYLIFITDGQPTFDLARSSDSRRNYNGVSDLNYTTSGWGQLMHRYRLTNGNKYTGTGGANSTSIDNLLKYVPQRYGEVPLVKKYSIGIGNEAIHPSNQSVLKATGPDGDYLVSNTVQGDLQKALKEIQSQIIDSISFIRKGSIVDPMSEYVNLKPTTIKTYQLKLKNGELKETPTTSNNVDAYAKNAKVGIYKNGVEQSNPKDDVDDYEIRVDDLTLTGDRETNNGYRLTYQVELKPEFRDGHFYPANKGTYLVDEKYNSGIGFAVPSIKYANRDIDVEKIWKGDATNHPDITIRLLANEIEVDQVILSSNKLKHTFKDVPILDDEGNKITYSIKEDFVDGYQSVVEEPKDGKFVVTNVPRGDFIAEKVASEKILRPGQTFTYKISVTNTVKDSVLKDLVVEDTMPEDIEIVGNLKLNGKSVEKITGDSFKVIIPKLVGNETAEVSIDVKVKENAAEGEKINIAKVTNPEDPDNPREPEEKVEVIRDLDLRLLKTDMDGKNFLQDAKFEIYQLIGDEEELLHTAISNTDGRIDFKKLKSGTYLIKEVSAPDGFKLLEKPIKITIDKRGVLELADSLSNMVSFKKVENTFELTVKNEEEPPGGILPQTGGFGNSVYTTIASVLMLVTLSLLGYYMYRNRKGWQ